MFDDLFTIGKTINLFKENYLDDFVDTLNYRIGCMTLIFMVLIMMWMHYADDPFICYYSTSIGGFNLDDYVESYCFVEGTIPIYNNKTVPATNEEWVKLANKSKITYYQWVPLVFCLQAVIFYLPHVIWRMLNHSSQRHNDIKRFVSNANDAKKKEGKARKEQVMKLASALENLVFDNRQKVKGWKGIWERLKSFFTVSNKSGLSTFTIYIIVKILYFIFSILQLVLMNNFIANKTYKHALLGYSIVLDILKGKPWQETLVFPRVSYCVVPIRQTSGMNYIIAQCSLPINMLHEKIYVFLWIFITTISIFNFISLIQVFLLGCHNQQKSAFINKFLKIGDGYKRNNEKGFHLKIKQFEKKMMKNDGVFILDLLSRHCGDIITGEIVKQLFDKFQNNNHNDTDTKCFDEDKIAPLCASDKRRMFYHSKSIPNPTAPNISFEEDEKE